MTIIKVDIDLKLPIMWLQMWVSTRELMLDMLGHTVKRFDMHKTKKGLHVFIEVEEEMDAKNINLLQFLLGDDHTRVKINSWRIDREVPCWNKLFSRKIYRKEAKTIDCYYCGNKIMIPKKILK